MELVRNAFFHLLVNSVILPDAAPIPSHGYSMGRGEPCGRTTLAHLLHTVIQSLIHFISHRCQESWRGPPGWQDERGPADQHMVSLEQESDLTGPHGPS